MTNKPVKSALVEKDGNLITETDSLGCFSIEMDSSINIELTFHTAELGIFAIAGLHFKKNEVLLISFQPECIYSPQEDIRQEKIKIIIIFTSFSPPLKPRDKSFEKKYKVAYYGYGDFNSGTPRDCVETYNKVIAEYLDKKYGKAWRREVNKEVLGL